MGLLLLLSGSNVVDLPSIDGASTPPGLDLLLTSAIPPLDIYLPSIDGASAPPGVNVYTETDLETMAAGAEVYAELREADGTWVADLEGAISVEWQDPLNEPGVGTLTINRHDADAVELTVDRRVWCYLYGEHVFTWIIEQPPELTMFDPGNESNEPVSASGRGINAALDAVLVYPPRGVTDPLAGAHRLYSFASVGFDEISGVPVDLGWPSAVELLKASELHLYRYTLVEWTTVLSGFPDVVEYVRMPAPIGFPDPDAYWIWGQSDTTVLGFNFFRRDLVITQEAVVAFVCTADNFHTLYLDGSPILGETEDHRCWSGFKRVEIALQPGTYQLAAVVENSTLLTGGTGANNPAGLLVSIFTFDSNGDPNNVLARSDSTWTALAYPATWPGWNPGRIVEDMILEAQSRGALTDLSYSFTAYNDSAGIPWPTVEGFSVAIGASVFDAMNQLVEQGWVDYRLDPGGGKLEMFIQGSYQTAPMTLQVTGDEATTNIESLSIIPQAPPRTRIFAKWTDGQFQLDDAPAQALYGVQEAHFVIDANTKTEAERQAQVILDQIKESRDAISVALAPKAVTDRPYSAYMVGDKIPTPTRTGTTAERLLSISVGHDELGRALIGLELQTRILQRERERTELVKQLGRGFTGSTKVRQTLTTTGGQNR